MPDSQTAIRLMKQTGKKVAYCCGLMDAAYEAGRIKRVSRRLDVCTHGSKFPKVPMAHHDAERSTISTGICSTCVTQSP